LYNIQIHVYCIKEEKRKYTLGKQDSAIDTYTAHSQSHGSKIVEVVNKNRCAVSMCAHWSETNNFIHIDETPANITLVIIYCPHDDGKGISVCEIHG